MLHGIAKIGTEFGPLNNSTAGLARSINPSLAITLSTFDLPWMGRKSPESVLLTRPSVTRCPHPCRQQGADLCLNSLQAIGLQGLAAGLHNDNDHTSKVLVHEEGCHNRQHGDHIGGKFAAQHAAHCLPDHWRATANQNRQPDPIGQRCLLKA